MTDQKDKYLTRTEEEGISDAIFCPDTAQKSHRIRPIESVADQSVLRNSGRRPEMKRRLLLLKVCISFAFFLVLLGSKTTLLYAHPEVQLKDTYGENVLDSNLPVSYNRSCGTCHDVDFINIGYHFQMGRLDVLPQAIYKRYHDKYGSPKFQFGLPLKQPDMSGLRQKSGELT
jgi:hypothetical protein